MGKGLFFWARAACALLGAGGLSACDLFGTAYPSKPCYPPQSGLSERMPSSSSHKGGAGEIDLYFDASQSMAGYIQGSQSQDNRPLQDLVSLTVGPSAQLGTNVRAFLFGSSIHKVKPDDISKLAQIGPYNCVATDQNCDNQQTHIDEVLNAIANSPSDRLSVVVTDLWLSNHDLISSRAVALGMPIRRIFSGGRSVIMMGVRAPYQGKIYDLPGGLHPALRTGDRPLFLLLAGPLERVSQFRDLLMRQQSPSFSPARVHSSVFTSESPPGMPVPRLKGPAGIGITRAVILDPHYRLGMQQLEMRPGEAFRKRSGGGWSASINAESVIPRDWVWQGYMNGLVRLWALTNPDALKSCAGGGSVAWRPAGEFKTPWSINGLTRATLVLDPKAEEFAHLPPGRIYMMVAQLRRGAIQHPSPATQWMREWSFEDADASALLAKQPPVFPTYKLAETAALLEAGLEEAAKNDSQPLVSVPLLMRVTR